MLHFSVTSSNIFRLPSNIYFVGATIGRHRCFLLTLADEQCSPLQKIIPIVHKRILYHRKFQRSILLHAHLTSIFCLTLKQGEVARRAGGDLITTLYAFIPYPFHRKRPPTIDFRPAKN